MQTFCDIKDLSYAKEQVPISCVNGLTRDYPDYVEYSNQRIPAHGVSLNLDEDFLICCDCTDGCRVSILSLMLELFMHYCDETLCDNLYVNWKT